MKRRRRSHDVTHCRISKVCFFALAVGNPDIFYANHKDKFIVLFFIIQITSYEHLGVRSQSFKPFTSENVIRHAKQTISDAHTLDQFLSEGSISKFEVDGDGEYFDSEGELPWKS